MLYLETLIKKINAPVNREEAYPSVNSDIYRLKDVFPPQLLIIYKPQSRHYREIGGTDEEKVIQLQTMSRLLRKYYDHSVVPMSYFLLESSGTPRIALIRPEVLGTPLDQLPLYSPERFEGFSKKIYWDTIWSELLEDPELTSLHPITRRACLFSNFSLSNIIYQAPESYYIIDW